MEIVDIKTNVQIQLTPIGQFLEVALYDNDPIADYDRAMNGMGTL